MAALLDLKFFRLGKLENRFQGTFIAFKMIQKFNPSKNLQKKIPLTSPQVGGPTKIKGQARHNSEAPVEPVAGALVAILSLVIIQRGVGLGPLARLQGLPRGPGGSKNSADEDMRVTATPMIMTMTMCGL